MERSSHVLFFDSGEAGLAFSLSQAKRSRKPRHASISLASVVSEHNAKTLRMLRIFALIVLIHEQSCRETSRVPFSILVVLQPYPR